MQCEELVRQYPILYHLAEVGSWPSIRERGLLSTTALLDLFEYRNPERTAIESRRRAEPVSIAHPLHGTAMIRDQKPLSESALEHCLDGMTPRQWCELLNRMVFFWPTEQRVRDLMGARAYRGRAHAVLAVDTTRLLARYGQRVWLSPINSGSTLYRPAARGRGTFRRPDEHPPERRVAEVAVEYAVPDIRDLVLSVAEWRDGAKRGVLWCR